MKKIILLLIFFSLLLFHNLLQAQNISFIKKVTNNGYNNYGMSILQGINNHYYLFYWTNNLIDNKARKKIVEFDNYSNKVDSIELDTIFNKYETGALYIEKKGNDFLYYATLVDSSYNLMYIRVFDTNLQIITEKVIDTIAPNEYISKQIVSKNGHHIFLNVITMDSAGFTRGYRIYETDSNFILIRKGITGFRDGIDNSIVEIAADSSYLITTRNVIMKTDYLLSHFDTVDIRWINEHWWTWCNTLKYNDSLYFESAMTGTSLTSNYPGFYIRSKNSEVIDTIAIPMNSTYTDNYITQLWNFMDFRTPDTIYYTSQADSKVFDDPSYSGLMIAKLNIDKTIFWQKYFGFDGNYQNGSITATNDGGCIVQWSFWDWTLYPSNSSQENIVLIKTDKYGNVATGVNENITINDKQILVYPNPASDQINFETGLYKDIDIKIYDINGQMQTESVLKQGQNNIDLRKFANGIYFYKIWDKERFVEDGKFVKE